jgi:hypothetical protein
VLGTISEENRTAVLLKFTDVFLGCGAIVGPVVTDVSNKRSVFTFSVKEYKKNDLKRLTLKMEGTRLRYV